MAIFAENLKLINQRRLRILVYIENVYYTKPIVYGKLVFILIKIQILYILPSLYRSITINIILKLLNLCQKTYDFHNKLLIKSNIIQQMEIQVLNSNTNCLFKNIFSIKLQKKTYIMQFKGSGVLEFIMKLTLLQCFYIY